MLMRDYTCGACREVFGTNVDEDDITCANCEGRRCPHCLIWFASDEGHEAGWPPGVLTVRHPGVNCLARTLPGRQHEGPIGAYVRLCPRGHLQAGYACQGCAGDGTALCYECPDDSPAILIPAGVFASLPFGTADEQLRQITEVTDAR